MPVRWSESKTGNDPRGRQDFWYWTSAGVVGAFLGRECIATFYVKERHANAYGRFAGMSQVEQALLRMGGGFAEVRKLFLERSGLTPS